MSRFDPNEITLDIIIDSIPSIQGWGCCDALWGRPANLWMIRNKGYELREEKGWSIEKTEMWIDYHQNLYKSQYNNTKRGQIKFVKPLKRQPR